jgi:hypothetical protein
MLGQSIWDKMSAMGNMLRNITLKTCWEIEEDILGTTKSKKSNPHIAALLNRKRNWVY